MDIGAKYKFDLVDQFDAAIFYFDVPTRLHSVAGVGRATQHIIFISDQTQ